MSLPLPEIFPDEDYRFHLTLRKGDVAEFFRPAEPALLAERARWLASEPQRYVGCEVGGVPAVEEFAAMARPWLRETETPGASLWPEGRAVASSPRRGLERLGAALAPDFLLLREVAPLDFRLEAGVVCFPSWWDPAEKFGLGLEAIHGVVPRLNPTLGATVGHFLKKLRPGAAFERANWGLAATPELNLHPQLARPRLTATTPPDQIWVRIEDQLLACLPGTGAILFGISLRILPWREVIADEAVRAGLERALRTMPEEVAAYKGLSEVRARLLAER